MDQVQKSNPGGSSSSAPGLVAPPKPSRAVISPGGSPPHLHAPVSPHVIPGMLGPAVQKLVTATVVASPVQAKLISPGVPVPPLNMDELRALVDNFKETAVNSDILTILGLFHAKADAAAKLSLENALLTGVLFGANTVLTFFINDGQSNFLLSGFAVFFRELPRELQTSLFEKYLLSEAIGTDAALAGSNEEGLISASLNRFIAAKDFAGLEQAVLAEIGFMKGLIEADYPAARDGINYNPALAYLRALKRILELQALKKGRDPQLLDLVRKLSAQWPDWLNPPQNEYKVLDLDPDLNYFQSVFLSHQARAAFDSFQYARTFLRNLGYSNLRHEILTHLETEQSKILKMWPENFRAPDAEIGILSDQLHAINQQLSAPFLMDGAVKRKLMVEKALVLQRLNLARKTALICELPDLALAFTLEKAIEHNRLDPGNRGRCEALGQCYRRAAEAINAKELNSLVAIYLNGLSLRSMNEAGLHEQEKQPLIEITARQIIERFQPATLQRLSRNAQDTFGLQMALYNEALPREGIGFFLNPRVSDQVVAKIRELLPSYLREVVAPPAMAGAPLMMASSGDDALSDHDEDAEPAPIGKTPALQDGDDDLDHAATQLLPASKPDSKGILPRSGGSPQPPILPPSIPSAGPPVSVPPPAPPPVEVISPGRKAIGYIAQLAAQIVSLETPAFQRNNNLTQILNLAETYPETRQAAFEALMRLIPQLQDVNFVISDQTDYASWRNGEPKSYVFLPEGYQSPNTTYLLHLVVSRELKMLQGADGEQKSMALLEALLAKGARLDLQDTPNHNSLLQKALQARNWPAVHVIIIKIAEMSVDRILKQQLLKGKTSVPWRLSALEALIRLGQPRLAVELIRAGAAIAGYVPETDDPDEGQIDSDHESGDLEYLRILTLAQTLEGTFQDHVEDNELVRIIIANKPPRLRQLPNVTDQFSGNVASERELIMAQGERFIGTRPALLSLTQPYKPAFEAFLAKNYPDIEYDTLTKGDTPKTPYFQNIIIHFVAVLNVMKNLFAQDLVELRGLQLPKDERELNLLLYQKYLNTFGRV